MKIFCYCRLSHASGNESIIDGRMYDTDTSVPREWE